MGTRLRVRAAKRLRTYLPPKIVLPRGPFRPCGGQPPHPAIWSCHRASSRPPKDSQLLLLLNRECGERQVEPDSPRSGNWGRMRKTAAIKGYAAPAQWKRQGGLWASPSEEPSATHPEPSSGIGRTLCRHRHQGGPRRAPSETFRNWSLLQDKKNLSGPQPAHSGKMSAYREPKPASHHPRKSLLWFKMLGEPEAGGVAQVVECLPSKYEKYESLSSIPTTAK
jgi:hypothetical protein